MPSPTPASLGSALKILALDVATTTGWALLCDGRLSSGVQTFKPRRGDSPGMRFLRFRAWLKEMWQLAGCIDLIAYERPHMRGGHATEVLVGLTTEIQAFCADADIEHQTVETGTLKKFATGRGNAGKDEMIMAASEYLGSCPEDDNHADAILILAWSCDQLGVTFPTP